MRAPFLRTILNRRPAAPPSPAGRSAEQIAGRIKALAEAWGRGQYGEADTFAEVVWLTRAILALNFLRLRVMGDPASLPVLHAYMRLAFEADESERLTVDARLNGMLRRKRGLLSQAGGRDLPKQADAAIDAPRFFQQLKGAMDELLGVVETPTESSFNEAAYLAANPDVAAAVAGGEAGSGKAHWLRHGKAEGRRQRRLDIGGSSEDLVFPLQIVRDAASNAPVGELTAGAPAPLRELVPGEARAPYAITTLSDTEEHNAAPSLRLETCIGRDSREFEKLLGESSWIAPPLYVAAFPNALADLRNGAVTFDGDKAWGDSLYATVLSPGGNLRAPEVFSVAGRYALLRKLDEEQRLESSTPMMLCTSWASRVNYGHWLMNTLFSIYLMRDELRSGRVRLLCPPLSERQRQEIITVGAPASAIVESDARYVLCERLLYPSPLSTYGNMKPPSRAAEFLAFVKDRFGEDEEGPAPELVYLSRLGFPSARRMMNERALCDALERLGFHIALPHEMTLGQQIRLMSRARLAVGQFGAALWNTPFMPHGADVIEIATSNYVSSEYLFASHLMGHRLSRVMIEIDSEPGAYAGKHFSFEAPVDEIAALASSLI